ncbi:LysM peptidoglycan-binding domain-containing protein [Limnohabitans radicicola]|uniref:LysM peptidoglycan-binding domain-containing protein n=1 Tax=Limnohabitans radicicola TaxID=2771427 RepID=A0A927FF72_9BURK|nr:LysM domain-containing protein [Limnohabitans radicicola]MBD8048943.1 LysM peptidoglycan-binding domain-containing protein [Limnohabitans radicicola]
MALQNPGITPATALTNLSSGGSVPGKNVANSGQFSRVLAQIAPTTSPTVQVQRGDTLIGLVKSQHRQQGLMVNDNQAFRLAHQIAADNRIANPDLIRPGQKIDFSRLNQTFAAKPPTVASVLDTPPAAKTALDQLRASTASAVPPPPLRSAANHPVLDQVLNRAVDKGFLPSSDLAGVRSKITQLAEKYNFEPDDFARLSLMESGGMNPRASNGHCHGIIQFCDGPARGAAAVGFPRNAKAILGMSLFKQLDLVDQYFSKVGMPVKAEKQGLDDLYLSILSPAARSEARPDAPLSIGGPQASWLHVDRNTRNPITRSSLVSGLHAMTEVLLGSNTPNKRPTRIYAEVANPANPGSEW